MNSARKKSTKEIITEGSYKYYHVQWFGHGIVTKKHPKESRNFIIFAVIFSILLATALTLLIVFHEAVNIVTGHPSITYTFTGFWGYITLLFLTFTLYHICSLRFEKKTGKLMDKYGIKKKHPFCRLVRFLLNIVTFPVIILSIIAYKILKKTGMLHLKDMVPFLIISPMFFLLFFLGSFGLLLKLVTEKIPLRNAYVTDKTWLYLAVFLATVIGQFLCRLFLKFMAKDISKNSRHSDDYVKEVLKKNGWINSLLLLFITLVLKALEFPEDEKVMVDAIFYTSSVLSIAGKLRK